MAKPKVQTSGLASKQPSKRVGYGATQLARETGFTHSYCSQMLKQGKSVDWIKLQAAKRNARGQVAKLTAQSKPSGKYVFSRDAEVAVPQKLAKLADVEDKEPIRVVRRTPRKLADEQGETLAGAQLRKEIAIADQREMEVAVRRAELVSQAEVTNYLATAIVASRDIMLRVGPENRDRWLAQTDPVKLEAMVTAEMSRALGELDAVWQRIEQQAPDAVEPETDRQDEDDTA